MSGLTHDLRGNKICVLSQSGTAVSHTGDTVESPLATFTLPGGLLGANGQIEIVPLFSMTNSANNKTFRVKFGATTMWGLAFTTAACEQAYIRIANRNSQSSQVTLASLAAGLGNSGSAVGTAAVDTSADVTVTITGQLALGSETVTLESYLVTLFRS